MPKKQVTPLSEVVDLLPAHSKSISLKYDYNEQVLSRFVVTDSLKSLFENISNSIIGGQCALTITGSYGTGKSFAMLLYSAVLSTDQTKIRKKAESIVGKKMTNMLNKSTGIVKNRIVVPIVGSRAPLHDLLGEALIQKGLQSKKLSPDELLKYLEVFTASKKEDGLLFVLDEMGKVLEFCASDSNSDVYFFQQLSELVSRSKGKIIFIGVLHQSIVTYFDGLDTKVKKEWEKVSGRFSDIIFTYRIGDQCQLISSMIRQKQNLPNTITTISKKIAYHYGIEEFAENISQCNPLHPSTAVFLTNYVRSGVAQNRRSIASFITGHEPLGLRYFVENAQQGELYTLDKLWDYINENIGSSLLATSKYFHKWILASDAVSRTERVSDTYLPTQLVKIISLLWLFGGATSIASQKNIENSLAGIITNAKQVEDTLDFLQEKSIIIYRKNRLAYDIFEGSDFDLENALSEKNTHQYDIQRLDQILHIFNPIYARRHYIKTGNSRHVDICIYLSKDSILMIENPESFGVVVLDVCDSNQYYDIEAIKSKLENKDKKIIYARCNRAEVIHTLINECQRILEIKYKTLVMSQDKVAQREIESRLLLNQKQIKQLISQVFVQSDWFDEDDKLLSSPNLRVVVSEIADSLFSSAPHIHNEMLNAEKPSGVSKRHTKILMKRLFNQQTECSFGYDAETKYPLDRAIYMSVIEQLFSQDENGTLQPNDDKIKHLWEVTQAFIKNKNEKIALTEIANIWQSPPFGLSKGVMPLFLWIFYLGNIKHLSLYSHGLYKTNIVDTDIDSFFHLTHFQFSWVEETKESAKIVDELKSHLNFQSKDNLGISRELVKRLDELPNWVKRTTTINGTAKLLRDYLKKAKDPNEVVLKKLPEIYFDADIDQIVKDISVLETAQEKLLQSYKEDISQKIIGEYNWEVVKKRVARLKDNTRNYILEAFIEALSSIGEAESDIEKAISVLAGRPLSQWTDMDKINCDGQLKKYCDMLVMMDSSWSMEDYSKKKAEQIKKEKETILQLLNKKSKTDALAIISLVNAELRTEEKPHDT